jgi:hypothetical protein
VCREVLIQLLAGMLIGELGMPRIPLSYLEAPTALPKGCYRALLKGCDCIGVNLQVSPESRFKHRSITARFG